MNENMENRSELLVKWLRVLMYIAIVSLANSIVNFLPFVPAAVTTWISRGIMAAVVVCMFRLTPANERYKKAGIMRAVMLVCTLITASFDERSDPAAGGSQSTRLNSVSGIQ